MPTQASSEADEPDLRRIADALRTVVVKVCPADLRPAIDDIVQTSLTRIVAQVRKSKQPLDFGAGYVWKAANHAVIDEIRKRSRSREVRSAEVDQNPASVGDPERAVRSGQIVRGIRECLQESSPDRRGALGLHLQGLNAPQIAKALGWSRKRCENLVYRGLAALRSCLRTKGLAP